MKTFVAVAVIAIIGTAAALQCFQCNSQTDSACSDNFNFDSPALKDAFVVTCKEEEGISPFCRKIKTYIERVDNTTVARVSRDCGYKKREGYECYQKRSEDYVLDTCQCDEALCNGAPTITTTTTSLATMMAVLVPFLARFL